MFAYCNNNPVNERDIQGSIPSSCASIKESGKKEVIRYHVDNYTQIGRTCWAYCQTMIEFYYEGIKNNIIAANSRAEELCKEVNGETDFLKEGWPTNLGNKTMVYSIEELFFILCEDGPVYAYYSYSDSAQKGAHMVVVCGVNLKTHTILVSNPWGYSGYQTFDEFMSGFYVEEGVDNLGMSLVCLYYVER